MALDIAARLRERRSEIEQATLARVHAVSDPAEVEDPEYAIGLKEAVSAALDYGILALEEPGREPAPVPERLLSQARVAARNGVSLDTVLRRYYAGYTLLGDFLIGGAENRVPIAPAELKRALRAEAAVFDRLVVAISEAHAREVASRPQSAAARRAERVKGLLAGKPLDTVELGYDLDAWHLAAIASGPGAIEALRDLVEPLDRSLLLIAPEEGAVWAWLGGRARLPSRELLGLAERLSRETSLAIGEPGHGIEGWRLSHRQAKAAMPVAQLGPERRVRYADVALLSSALRDDLLASSLHGIYLAPLEGERDGGAALRRTLAAYFTAGRNASSAAALLGINRNTVSLRLRSIAEKIGRPVDICAAEMETALRLQELAHRTMVGRDLRE